VTDAAPTPDPTDTEPTPPARRGGLRAAIAAGVAIVIVTAAVWVAVATGGNDDGPRPLALLGVGAGAERDASTAAADAMLAAPIELTLAGDLPDLGSRGPVYELASPSNAHDAAVRIAEALGIDGPVRDIEGGAEAVGTELTVNVYDAGGLQVSVYTSEPAIGGGSSGSAGVSSPGATGTVPPRGPDTATSELEADLEARAAADELVTLPFEPPSPPKNLPSPGEAERIARDLLDRMGVLDGADWDAEVTDNGAVIASAVECGPARECQPEETVVLSRSVTLHRLLDGHRISGLAWYVDVGDQGVVGAASGSLARLDLVDDYPLRPVRDAYDQLASGSGIMRDLVQLAPGAVAGNDGPAIDPAEPVTPTRVTVTGATRGAMLMSGLDGDLTKSYVVPSYRFTGTYESGEAWESEVLALSPDYVTEPSTTVPTEPGGAEPGEPGVTEPMPLPEPDPSAATTVPGVVQSDDGNLELHVSNQSFDVTPVDITVMLDGEQLVAQEFDVESQHTWIKFSFDVKTGPHTLAVTANDGSVSRDAHVEIGSATKYGIVNFWDAGQVEITFQDTPPAFA
jgi:hypothetical protein